jgi:multicomponent Na+:H+ antiporter subunit B
MKNIQKIIFYSLSFILVALISFMLMLAVTEMPPYGNINNPTNNYVWERYVYKGVEESGGLNLVANILLDYRGYDTLLESTVLFATVVSIMIVWGTSSVSKEKH